MPSFEETRNSYEKELGRELTLPEAQIADYFWDGALFAANSKLGDEGNEAMKDARRKVAVQKIQALDLMGYISSDDLNAIIKECQG